MKQHKLTSNELYITSIFLIFLIVSLNTVLEISLPVGHLYLGSILILTMCQYLPQRIALIVGSIAATIADLLLQNPYYAIFSFFIQLIMISLLYFLMNRIKEKTPAKILGIYLLVTTLISIMYALVTVVVNLNFDVFTEALVSNIPQILIISIISTILYPYAEKLKVYF